MFGKSARERMKRKIEKLEKELSDERQNNTVLSNENKILQRKYEEAEKRSASMRITLRPSFDKYNREAELMRKAREEYETMISELRVLRQDYEKEMKSLLASVSKRTM